MSWRRWAILAFASGCTNGGVVGVQPAESSGEATGSTSLETSGEGSDDSTGMPACECGVRPEYAYLWVASGREGTVSKIDLDTVQVVARYATRPDVAGDPSRTSVSPTGDRVAIANRNGGIAAIWSDPALCDPYRNGAEGLQTSQGAEDVLEFDEDDCIAWFRPFEYGSQRPVAWAPTVPLDDCSEPTPMLWTSGCSPGEDPWITAHRLDGDSGVVVDTLEVVGFPCEGVGGYTGAVDGRGNFWVNAPEGYLARIDVETLEARVWSTPIATYSLVVDRVGRLFFSLDDNTANTVSAVRFDPRDETWASASDVLLIGATGIQIDAEDRVWLAYRTADGVGPAGVTWFDPETMAMGERIGLPAVDPKGVAVDPSGRIWVTALEPERVYRIDPDTGNYDQLQIADPYTHSDMTGLALQRVACDRN